MWKTISNLTKPPQSKQKVSNIIYEDKILTNAKDISNAFNNFFTTIGTKLESQLPHALCDPMQYLLGDFPNLMTKSRITINDIFREVKTLKNKSCNTADFSPQLIKENCRMLAFPLTFILNQSLDQGEFPTRLKAARVTPIYNKKGA